MFSMPRLPDLRVPAVFQKAGLYFAVAIALVAGLTGAVYVRSLPPPNQMAGIPLDTVRRGALVDDVSVAGTVAPIATHLVGPVESGIVSPVLVAPGASARSLRRADDQLAALEAARANPTLEAKRANMDEAGAALAQAEARLQAARSPLTKAQARAHAAAMRRIKDAAASANAAFAAGIRPLPTAAVETNRASRWRAEVAQAQAQAQVRLAATTHPLGPASRLQNAVSTAKARDAVGDDTAARQRLRNAQAASR